MKEPRGWWFCRTRVSPDCEVMCEVNYNNCPRPKSCNACRKVRQLHFNRKHQLWQKEHRRKEQERLKTDPRRRCVFEGCKQPVYRHKEYGEWVEHRCLCLYHWQHGEDLYG